MPSVYDYRHIELDRIGSGKKRLAAQNFRGEDTQSRLFGSSSPPESPRRLSTSSSGSSVHVSPGFLIKASHQKSNIFATDPLPASPASSRSSSISNLPMSPGRLIKASHQRSKIFAQDPVSPASCSSSSAGSVASLPMSPGRLIKESQRRSNIFPQQPAAAPLQQLQTSPSPSEQVSSLSSGASSTADLTAAGVAADALGHMYD